MSETWQRRVLYIAGAWNMIGGAGALADPRAHFAQFYTTALSLQDPLQAFFFRTTWINAIAWPWDWSVSSVISAGVARVADLENSAVKARAIIGCSVRRHRTQRSPTKNRAVKSGNAFMPVPWIRVLPAAGAAQYGPNDPV